MDSGLEWKEIPKPIGDFILAQKDLSHEQTVNGAYWHYTQVCELLKRYAKQQSVETGLVWIKASVQMPTKKINRERLSIKYKGQADVLICLEGEWHWLDFSSEQSYEQIRDGKGAYYKVQPESWSAIEWLDESGMQQLFTREGTYKMVMDMGRHFRNIVPTLALINDWFNKNYPIK